MNTLALALPNEVITVHGDDNPVFSNLVLITANGRITTTEFVTSDSVVLSTANGGIKTNGLRGHDIKLSTANGHIDVDIDALSGNLIGSSANGKIDLSVASISGTTSEVKLSTANGNIDVSLVSNFKTIAIVVFMQRTILPENEYNSHYKHIYLFYISLMHSKLHLIFQP